MSAVQPFSNGEFELPIAFEGDDLQVPAAELARYLGYRDASNMTRSIPDNERGYSLVSTPAGDLRVWYVTEAGFYRAMGQRQASRIPDAHSRARVERFQAWVFGEVLPALRQRGTYSIPAQRSSAPGDLDPATVDRRTLAVLILEAEDARELAEQRAITAEAEVAELVPAATAWNTLAAAAGEMSVADAAKILTRDGIPVGRNRLFQQLYRLGWTYRGQADQKWHAMQSAIETGRLVELPDSYKHPHTGEEMLTVQVAVTVKGLAKLRELLGQ